MRKLWLLDRRQLNSLLQHLQRQQSYLHRSLRLQQRRSTMAVVPLQRAFLLLAGVCFRCPAITNPMLSQGDFTPANYNSNSGAPSNVPSIVSRTVNADYWQRQCPLFFPEVNGYTYGSASGRTAEQVNAYTQGWDLTNTTRLMWANGYYTSHPRNFPFPCLG